MSTPGKIFIVLNLVLSAVFLGWASNNLAKRDTLSQDLVDAQAELTALDTAKTEEAAALNARIQTLEGSMATLRQERDTFETESKRLGDEMTSERDRGNALEADITAIRGSLGSYDETNRLSQERLDQAVTAQREADEARRAAEDERETALAGQRAAEETLKTAEDRIADLEATSNSLNQQVASLTTSIEALGTTYGIKTTDLVATPYIDGAVLQVVSTVEPGLVAINKGSADGVLRGFIFEVYNGQTYKGQVRVESVQANMCTAVIVRAPAGTSIGQGDRASTRI